MFGCVIWWVSLISWRNRVSVCLEFVRSSCNVLSAISLFSVVSRMWYMLFMLLFLRSLRISYFFVIFCWFDGVMFWLMSLFSKSKVEGVGVRLMVLDKSVEFWCGVSIRSPDA